MRAIARLIGEAYVAILPETAQFGPDADAKIRQALNTLHPNIELGASINKAALAASVATIKSQLAAIRGNDIGLNFDNRQAISSVTELESEVLALRDRAKAIPLSIDDSKGLATFYSLDAKAAELQKVLETLDPEMNPTKWLGQFYNIESQVKVLETQLSHMDMNGDPDQALEHLAVLTADAGQLSAMLKNLQIDSDDTPFLAKQAQLQAQVMALAKELSNMPMDANTLPIEAKLLATRAQIEALGKSLDNVGAAGTSSKNLIDPTQLAAANADLDTMAKRLGDVDEYLGRTGEQGSTTFNAMQAAIGDVTERLAKLQDTGIINPDDLNNVKSLSSDLNSLAQSTGLAAEAADSSYHGYGLWGTAISALKTKIPLFGGALVKLHFPDWLAQASGTHMLLESIVELTAVWGPLTIAAAAFGAIAYSTGKSVYTQFMDMSSVIKGTGASFTGMKGTFQEMENAIKPEVLQLWGDYITLAGNGASHFQGVMVSVGKVLDTFGADIATDLNSKTTSNFLQHASSDLAGVGDAFAQVGRIVGDLMKDVPGYAEMLLKFGDAGLTGLADVVSAVNPAIAVFLKLHGAIFYLGLATTAVLTFGRAFAAAGIAKGAESLGMASTSLATWANDFTSDNDKVSEAAGNSGSKLSKWATGLGGLFGNLVGGIASFSSATHSYVKDLADFSSTNTAGATASKVLQDALSKLPGVSRAGSSSIEMIEGELVKIPNASKNATGGLEAFGTSVAELAGDFGPIGLAVAGIAAGVGTILYLALKKTGDEAQQFGQQIQNMISNSTPADLLTNLGTASQKTAAQYSSSIKTLNAEYASAGKAVNSYAKALTSVPTNTSSVQEQSVKSILKSQQELTDAQQKYNEEATKANPYANSGQAVQAQQYAAQLQQIAEQSTTATGRLESLSRTYGGLSGAISIATLAGVRGNAIANDSASAWAKAEQAIKSTAAGYGYLGQQAGAAGNQLDALNISTSVQLKDVQSLASAESAWISLITGGVTSFATFEQGQTTLADTLNGKMNPAVVTSTTASTKAASSLTALAKGGSDATKSLTTTSSTTKAAATSADTMSVTLGKITEKFNLAGASMKGTSTAALAAQQAFASQLSSGVALYGNLQQLASASGNTKAAQSELAAGGKAIVAQLLPMAAGSKEATGELSALAQLMGGPATDNFQTLAKWAGNSAKAEDTLNSSQTKLTLSSIDLTKAAQNLGVAVSSLATSEESAAIAKTDGLSQAISGLATDAEKTSGQVTKASLALSGEYVSALEKTGVGTTQAKQDLNAYLSQLGYTPAAIATIDASLGQSTTAWNKYETAQAQNTKASKDFQTAATNNENALKGLAGGLVAPVTYYNELWAALVKQDTAMVKSGNDATAAKSQFQNFATQGLDVSASAAQQLWAKFGNQNLDSLAAKAGSTKTSFINLAEQGLHLSTTQAQQLWNAFAMQNLDSLASKGDTAKDSFMALAKNGLDLTTTSANTLWNTLEHQYLDTLAGKAGETENAFVKVASQFGLTKAAAEQLWTQLHTLSAGSPYPVNVNETLTGSGAIKASVNATGITLTSPTSSTPRAGVSSTAILAKAAGGVVSGGIHGQDSVHTMLAPGELVIPTTHAAAHMVQAKREGIPGMAAGGTVGGTLNASNASSVANAAATGVGTASSGAISMTAQAMASFVSQVNGALTAAAGAAGGAFGGVASAAGAANLLTIAKYLMANGLNRAAAAGVAGTIDGESGGNPESRNCVPLTYKVVTNRGILTHDQVRVGDMTSVYDPHTNRVELATILDVPYHDAAKICRIGNGHWSVICTWDHKWITPFGLMRADEMRGGDTKILLGDGWWEPVEFFEDRGREDTFCLTTTTGTWTVYRDEQVAADEGVEPGAFWTGNSGGWGLIGWTGNTVGLPAGYTGPTGNLQYDMSAQLKGVIGYMNARGGRGPLNAAGSAIAAGDVWSRYEAPLNALSDTRPSVANQIYAELGGSSTPSKAVSTTAAKPHSAGGMITEPVAGIGMNSGSTYSFGESGPEQVIPGGAASVGQQMQPATQTQMMTLINLIQQQNTLLKQQPNATGRAISKGMGAGANHGAYAAGR